MTDDSEVEEVRELPKKRRRLTKLSEAEAKASKRLVSDPSSDDSAPSMKQKRRPLRKLEEDEEAKRQSYRCSRKSEALLNPRPKTSRYKASKRRRLSAPVKRTGGRIVDEDDDFEPSSEWQDSEDDVDSSISESY